MYQTVLASDVRVGDTVVNLGLVTTFARAYGGSNIVTGYYDTRWFETDESVVILERPTYRVVRGSRGNTLVKLDGVLVASFADADDARDYVARKTG